MTAKTRVIVNVPAGAYEEWRPVPDWESLYLVSNFGRFRNSRTGHVLAMHYNHGNYAVIGLCRNGKQSPFAAHRLVLRAFGGEPPMADMHVCHVNGDRTDNRPENMYWGTPVDNADDMRRHNTHRNGRKTHCEKGHEFTPQNTYVQPSKPGTRACVKCRREIKARFDARQKMRFVSAA